MYKILMAALATILATSAAKADDSYLSELEAEASKITTSAGAQQLHQQHRKLMLSAPSASTHLTSKVKVFGKRPRKKDISLRGFAEILRFQASGSFELFQQLSLADRQDVLEAYNTGASLADLRPMIASLYQ